MTAYKKYVTIKDPKSLVLTDLPFKQGQVVEVVVIAEDNGESEERVRDVQALLRETQALPQAQAISEDEIAAEIECLPGGSMKSPLILHQLNIPF